MSVDTSLAQQMVDVMNRALESDPDAVEGLISSRIPCNLALANDPTIQVGRTGGRTGDNSYEVGLLGVLNGIAGADSDGWGHVAAQYKDGKIVDFRLIRESAGER